MNNSLNDQLLIILSSPSGAGKSTLARLLAGWDKTIKVSISATTRPSRDNENEGIEYYFLTKNEFQQKIDDGKFLEYAEVFGNLYGTPLSFIEECQKANLDVVFDIDWQGSMQIRNSMFREKVVSIFVLPPSIQELDNRLRRRGADSRAMVEGRMDKCKDEISHWTDYDYVLINNQLEEVLEQIKAIVKAERLKRTRCTGLSEFVNKLNQEFESMKS